MRLVGNESRLNQQRSYGLENLDSFGRLAVESSSLFQVLCHLLSVNAVHATMKTTCMLTCVSAAGALLVCCFTAPLRNLRMLRLALEIAPPCTTPDDEPETKESLTEGILRRDYSGYTLSLFACAMAGEQKWVLESDRPHNLSYLRDGFIEIWQHSPCRAAAD
jgi:hypothetical protein